MWKRKRVELVALCDANVAHHFLQDPKSISTDALALLLLDSPGADLSQYAGLKPIIIPAKFRATDEHTLIYGHILQLGDNQVVRELASQDSNPEVIETKVLKFQVFRDQLTMDWLRFVEAPIRALVSSMDSLQLCKGANCGASCGRFHPGLDESIDNVIFEVWTRSFFDANGRKAAPEQATLFTAFLRVPEGAMYKILTTTPSGVYAEPRGAKPREHDAGFKVVWMPGSSYEEVAHLCKTYDRAVCMVRLKTKYGVRVRQEDEAAAWAFLRPGANFVALNILHTFELFPLPHGTQRQAIIKLLDDWKWTARPLQPGRGNASHMAWRVGAQTPPPHSIMTGFQNDVVITQVKELHQPEPPQQLIASSKTHRHLRAAPSSGSTAKVAKDPWTDLSKDPWANYATKSAPAGSGAGKTRLSAIHEQLRSDLSQDLDNKAQAAIQAAAASSQGMTGQQEQRLQALEVGLHEIKGQNAQFTTWFQQAGERLKATEATMGAMQQTLNTHQHEIHTLGSTFQNTMKTVKDDLASEMNDSFNKQFSRLEALLEKKQRTD